MRHLSVNSLIRKMNLRIYFLLEMTRFRYAQYANNLRKK
ncbi:hypothetical protein EaACW_1828 [Erwinia amylovora ACW56400]|uniref:Uncharacterized protein n=1 Tax=Erwinia amylovora NBRC 12687 = CFBP 1232 TaxID=1219359 RepID=A0A831EQQ7_ERWAM|nr:hypothetical protein EaACW_1828 [Erwinia amylovora ACW56400]CCO78675.1 hypothetical protein BN432_1877 [Erwinia amylovora Ea356]CCO86253.1 hypothetical protein BN434_1865 [Erwinia amylovora CFBP 2585]CCO90041.1 hypothetical protein BN435_1870 [Erwinia amylovora 01SFR-BO]CCO93804.1 hypothetical protein BN437_1874 [Erwinia amylovora NBRC 12687 = CFBP 1232]CCO99153.1 hypothetical protein BN438_1871 [Erwinia amylovora UPN527]